MKKALRETQTLLAGCSKAEPKIFAPPQTPFPGARDGQNLIILRWSLHLPTHPRCTQFRFVVVTDPQTHPQNTPTDRSDYNTLHHAQLARSVISMQHRCYIRYWKFSSQRNGIIARYYELSDSATGQVRDWVHITGVRFSKLPQLNISLRIS